MSSPLKGKKMDNPVAVTLTDFGQPGRRSEIRRHFSLPAAFRAYREIWEIYHQMRPENAAKVWVELCEGGVPVGGPAE
jgi:hypothetical protein